MPHEDIPWYCANLPRSEWPPSCPDYLIKCSEKDKGIIGNSDESYVPLSWDEVGELVRE